LSHAGFHCILGTPWQPAEAQGKIPMDRGQTRCLALRVLLLAGPLAVWLVAGERPVAAEAIEPDLAAAADLLAAEKFDAARAALLKLATEHPGEAEIQAELGKIAFELRQYTAAVTQFERAIGLAPLEADYHFELGRALIGRISQVGLLKKPGIARRLRAAFEEALRLEPDHTRARLALVSYLANAPGIMGGSKKKALAQARRLKETDLATYHRALARIARKDKDFGDAFAHYRTSLDQRSDGRTRSEFAEALEEKDQWDEALRVLNPVAGPGVSESAPLQVFLLYGRAAAESGQRLEAGGRALDHFIAADRRRKSKEARAESHYLRGRIFEAMGQSEAAQGSYRMALEVDKGHKEASRASKRLDAGRGGG